MTASDLETLIDVAVVLLALGIGYWLGFTAER